MAARMQACNPTPNPKAAGLQQVVLDDVAHDAEAIEVAAAPLPTLRLGLGLGLGARIRVRARAARVREWGKG